MLANALFEEPDALIALVRVCGGLGEQPPGLPGNPLVDAVVARGRPNQMGPPATSGLTPSSCPLPAAPSESDVGDGGVAAPATDAIAVRLRAACCGLPGLLLSAPCCQAAALQQPKTGSAVRPGFGALRSGRTAPCECGQPRKRARGRVCRLNDATCRGLPPVRPAFSGPIRLSRPRFRQL